MPGQTDNTPQCIDEETIDLRELFVILKHYKTMIIGVTAAITLLAALYAFVIAKPVYEAKAIVEIGQIDSEPIDDIKNIQQKLVYEYKVNARGAKKTLPRITAISVPKGSNRLISLTTHAYTDSDAAQYVKTVIENIESAYKKKTDAYIENQKEMIALTRKDIVDNEKNLQKMQQELDDYSQRIISLKSEDAALAGIYALQIGQKQTELQNLKRYISSLKRKEQELKLSITPLKMQPTQIAGDIELSDTPVKPKKALIVIVAFITGLMLSVFLAFFINFLRTEVPQKD